MSCRTSAPAPTSPTPAPTRSASSSTRRARTSPTSAWSIFTAQEPARVAAAGRKCFYFQRDHWTGSVVEGQQPELWHWDGDYWFDRARGLGGVSIRNFRLGGTTQSAGPFVPEAYKPYFDEDGGGGVEVLLESNPDPTCAVKVDTPEERDRVYAGRAEELPCIEPGGVGGRRVGRVKLGMTRDRVLARIGPPEDHAKRVDRWCLIGKGELRTAYDMRGLIAALASGPGQALHGVSRGDRLQRARRLLDVVGESHVIGVGRVLSIRPAGRSHRVVGARRQRVRWVALLSRPLAPGLGLRLSRKVR